MGVERFSKSLKEIISHLEKVKETVDPAAVERVAFEIAERKRVFVYGAGRSGLVAK